jgi:hypothetical protein
VIEPAELAELHTAVEAALERGDEGTLTVIGWGEISLGVGWPGDVPRIVAKRLPRFPDRAAFDRYRDLIDRYAETLRGGGIDVVPTELLGIDEPAGTVVGYGVQAILPAETLGPRVLAAADPAEGHPLVDAVCGLIAANVSDRVGIDAQLSNWAWIDGAPRYFDVTTPLLNDAAGHAQLDAELLLAAYPAVSRPALRRFVVPTVIARYHDRRSVLRDVAANLIKERLEQWIDPLVAASAPFLDEPLDRDEIRRDYRSDARMWEAVQRVRRLDRGWYRLRRRTYPFLIPGQIER